MNAVQHELARLPGASASQVAQHFFDTFGVVAQNHLDGKLWLFDYDQLAAHKHRTSPVVMESRGLILDAESGAVIRRPFARFFNIGEAQDYEADIDYARLRALEKVDGSLVTLYFNERTGFWHFGTRGTPFANAKHRLGGTFADRVCRAAGLAAAPGTPEFNSLADKIADREVTYLFEFIGPDNPHVTPHPQSELVVLGARHRDGSELSAGDLKYWFETLQAEGWNVREPETYAIPLDLRRLSRPAQVEAIKRWVASDPAFKGLHEGLVCQDPVTGKRLKVKTPLYCAAHLQGGDEGVNLSKNRIVELVVNGDAGEFMLYMPHLAAMVQKADDQVGEFLEGLDPVWEAVRGIEDQKTFALAVQEKVGSHASGLYFLARKLGITPRQAWAELPFNKQVSMASNVVKV